MAVPGALVWREWEDGCVIFNRATGETHYLDLFTSFLLRLIEAGAVDPDSVSQTVAAELGEDLTPQFEARVARAMLNFETLALVERPR
jgi:PqqD family protein of HPr-rel-A system